MKKNVKPMTLASFCLFLLLSVNTLIGQINLEHTFPAAVSWTGIHNVETVYPNNSYVQGLINENSYNLKIYNSDYSLSSNTTYNFSGFQDYTIQSVWISKKVFNTNESFEFLVLYSNSSVSDNTRQKLILFDSNGSIIKDFGSAYNISSDNGHVMNDNLRLRVGKLYINNGEITYQTEIYSVPGVPEYNDDDNSTSGLIQNDNDYLEVRNAYPNPTNSSITLPYTINEGSISTMDVFDITGKLIESKTIDSHFNQINLNVTNYKSGTYFYVVNGVSKKFIVE